MKPILLPFTLLAWFTLAGGPTGPPPQTSFRVSTDLVVLDVSVVARDGTPAAGLAADDFEVKVDGQPRRVASLRFVDAAPAVPPAGPTEGPAPGGGAAAPRFSTNEAGAAGRLVLVVVDEASIPAGGFRAAAESIGKLLAGFGPADRLALAALPGPRILVDFTRDRTRVTEGIKRVSGGASWAGAAATYQMSVLEAFGVDRGDARVSNNVINRECALFASDLDRQRCPMGVRADARRIVAEAGNRTRQFVSAFGTLLAPLARIDAPKLVILFCEGLPSPEAPATLQAFAPDVAAARATIQVMRLERSTFEPSERPLSFAADDRTAATASLDALAGIGGGTVFDVVGSGDTPFQRLAAAASAYYLIGIEPEGTDRDGKAHRIEVAVRKPGVGVRARPIFIAPRAAEDDAQRLARTLQSPLPATELPLRITAFSLADEDPARVRVLVVGEIDRQQQRPGAAAVGFVLIDPSGKVCASYSRRLELSVGSSGRLAFAGGASVAPGSYTLRLAAVRDGRAGSAEHPVTARLASVASLQLGDLVLGEPPPPGRMFVPPVDARLRGDRIVGFLQLGHKPGLKPALAIEIVQRQDGPALLTVPFELQPSRARATAIQVSIDAHLLPPGDYDARLTVSMPGTAAARVFAPFSLERAPRAAGPPAAAEPAAPPAPPALRFKPEDVLDAAVLGPFLDELAARASEASRGAIERARAGQLNEALAAVKPGSLTDPTEPFLRGLTLLSKGEVQPASDAFRDAVRVAPDFLIGAFYIGACYAAGGRTTQAINAWQTSLIGLGRYPAVYRLLGDALVQAGEATRGAAVLAKGAARFPGDAELGARAMEAALDAGNYDEAMARADQVLAQQPGNTDVLFLAMRATFQTALDTREQPLDALLARLRRYRDLYVAAGGPRQALVAAWVAFVEGKVRDRQALLFRAEGSRGLDPRGAGSRPSLANRAIAISARRPSRNVPPA